jgi:hypothetical protein
VLKGAAASLRRLSLSMHDSEVVARVWTRRNQRSMACLEALDIHVHMLTAGEWQEGPAMHAQLRALHCAQLACLGGGICSLRACASAKGRTFSAATNLPCLPFQPGSRPIPPSLNLQIWLLAASQACAA